MIKQLNLNSDDVANRVLDLQMPSYKVEAEIIDFYDIPPLKDTIKTIKECHEIFYGYFIKGTLAGIISYKLKGSTLDIHRVAIHPDFFRIGIAKELLYFVENHEERARKIIVSTGKGNTPAINLYLKMGYIKVQDIKISQELYVTSLEKVL